MPDRLTIAVFADSAELLSLLGRYLSAENYDCEYFTDRQAFLDSVAANERELDCLVLFSQPQLGATIDLLTARGILLPIAVFRQADPAELLVAEKTLKHAPMPTNIDRQPPTEVMLAVTDMSEIGIAIDKAIAKFLNLQPSGAPTAADPPQNLPMAQDTPEPTDLHQQQSRLAQKLNERLGYLAVYYKRNPQQFYRRLDRQQKQEFIDDLKLQYRQIVLDYFAETNDLNVKIDEYVSAAFFKDLAVSEIVKIHMELMEEFADQLKLEGRSEEILLDYRLTLIDIVAHLCEMYRRSIPREL